MQISNKAQKSKQNIEYSKQSKAEKGERLWRFNLQK